jgi:hypothetical protein
MKTPPAPTRLLVERGAPLVDAAKRWDAAPVPVVVEPPVAMTASALRMRLRERAPIDHPQGKALARLRQFVQQRGLPPPRTQPGTRDAPRPREARVARRIANAVAAPRPKPFKAATQLPAWRELGPTLIPHGQTYGSGTGASPPVSGRTNGLVVDRADPRHLVLSAAGGGLWSSLDAGATWTPLTDHQPTLVMGGVVQSASAPQVMYAATGEGDAQIPYGVGLLRSSDSGRSWTHVPAAALTGIGVYGLAVHPTDPLRVWVAHTGGLHASSDGGNGWRRAMDEVCWNVAIHPLNPQEMFVACESGLMRSIDGGASWRRVSLPGTSTSTRPTRMAVAFAPSAPDRVLVAACVNDRPLLWLRSAAGGAFAAQSAPAKMDIGQAWYDWCLAASPHDPDLVYWGAVDLYRGKRGASGFRWTRISSHRAGDSIHPDQHAVVLDPSARGVVYACNDGGVFRSADGGDHWQPLNPGLGITEFEFLAQLESAPAWILGGTQDNGTLAHGGQRHWDQIALGDGGDCASVDRGPASICYHSYYDMALERAAAIGPQAFAWSDISPPTPEGYAALFYPPVEARGSVVAKAGASVWVSADEGAHWSEVALPTSGDNDPDLATALAILDDATLIVGTQLGRLYRIARGADWSQATVTALGALRGGYVSDIAAPEGDSRTLWVACSSAPRGGGHVFRSTDGGARFVDRSAKLPGVAVNALVIDPRHAKVVYAATDRGVHRTRNAGAAWEDFSNGLPNAIVGDLVLHATKRLLRAGTRSRGAWEVDLG